ncbi:MAG TPA: ABC transporter permease [Acidimicrobiales bacterium]|nr:ABC transporter permease [Acidimicrobiales bacterium]
MTRAPAAARRAAARRSVDLAVVLVARDLRASYGTAALGLLWAPLTALVQVGVLSFLFLHVVPLDIPDYTAFVFCGVAAWQLLSGALVRSTEAFTDNRDLVRRPGFPTVVLPLVTVGTATSAYLLSLPVLLAVLVATDRLRASAALLPVVVAATAAVVAGPALVVASANARFRDVRHVVGAAVGVLFYLTPVFYDVADLPARFRWVAAANPLALVVRLHRQVLYEGRPPGAGLLAGCLAVGLAGTAVGLAVHHRAAAHLADEL